MLTWLIVGLTVIGAIVVACMGLVMLMICAARLRRPQIIMPEVLAEMAEQRVPFAELDCRCKVYLLPDGDSYVLPCRRHSYMRNPDFAAWLVELGGQGIP